ncbi:hypothetical protein D9M71_471700 [compost metagenome]
MHVAVEHAQRRGNHPRSHVVVHAHRRAIQRLGIEHGILTTRQGDLCQLFRTGAVFMEVTLGIQRHQVDTRLYIEGGEPLPGVAAVATLGFIGQGTRLLVGRTGRRFGDGAKYQYVFAQARSNRHGAVDHTRQRAGAFVTAAEPVDVEAEGAFQCAGANWRKRVAIVVIARPARHAVDVAALQAGISNGFEARIEGQAHGGFV